jgi:hypothetical protein
MPRSSICSAWKWTYEPIDLGGWIPDFAIEAVKTPILVEVKPIFEFDENCHRCQSPGRSAAR